MRRVRYVLAALLAATALTGSSAAARDNEWCAEDPVFEVLGATFRITTFINAPASAVTEIQYLVEVPENAGDVTVTTPPGEVLATVTEVEISYAGKVKSGKVKISMTGKAYDPQDGSFKIRVKVIVSGPDLAKVIAQLDGPSVEPDTFKGHTNKPVKFHFDVTP